MYLTVALALVILGAFLTWGVPRIQASARAREETHHREEYRKLVLQATLEQIRDAVIEDPEDKTERLLTELRQLREQQVLRNQIEDLTSS